jgi:hypothetical protein
MKSLRPLFVATVLLAVPWVASAQVEEARVIVRFKPQADSVRAKALSVRATATEARDVAQTRAAALGPQRRGAIRRMPCRWHRLRPTCLAATRPSRSTLPQRALCWPIRLVARVWPTCCRRGIIRG